MLKNELYITVKIVDYWVDWVVMKLYILVEICDKLKLIEKDIEER